MHPTKYGYASNGMCQLWNNAQQMKLVPNKQILCPTEDYLHRTLNCIASSKIEIAQQIKFRLDGRLVMSNKKSISSIEISHGQQMKFDVLVINFHPDIKFIS